MDHDDFLEEKVYQWAMEKRHPIYGILELTFLCNMHCKMCYVHSNHSETEKKSRILTASNWLSLAEEMKKSGVLFLLLTGGEPLLYPEFRSLYVELHRMGMILTVNTNGTLIDENWADFFGKYKPRRLNITLYGSSFETYEQLCHYGDGFKKVLNAIEFLKKNHVDVRLGCSLTRYNMHEYPEILALGDRLGMPVHIDTYMYPTEQERSLSLSLQTRMGPKEAAHIYIDSLKKCIKNDIFKSSVLRELSLEQYVLKMHKINQTDPFYAATPRKMTCTAGSCSFVISCHGKMRPCVVMPEPEIDVFQNGFQKSWEYLVKETNQIFLNVKCTDCELRSICRTCAACALLEGGTYDSIPEYMCAYARHMLEYLKNL